MTRKVFEKGDVIIKEGMMESCMYDIVIGMVGIYGAYGTPDANLIAVLKDGQCFGEMEMLSIRARSATAVAMEKTEVIVIDKKTFGDYCRNKPEKVLAIMEQLSDKLRKTTAEYMEACLVAKEALREVRLGTKKSRWYDRLKDFAEKF